MLSVSPKPTYIMVEYHSIGLTIYSLSKLYFIQKKIGQFLTYKTLTTVVALI